MICFRDATSQKYPPTSNTSSSLKSLGRVQSSLACPRKVRQSAKLTSLPEESEAATVGEPSHLHHKPLLEEPWTRAKLTSLLEESEAATVGEPLEAARRMRSHGEVEKEGWVAERWERTTARVDQPVVVGKVGVGSRCRLEGGGGVNRRFKTK